MMECASKPSFMGVKLTHLTPPLPEDSSTVSGDDSFIDDLLDFPADAAFLEENGKYSPLHDTNNDKTSPVKTTIPETELCLPVGDLEWVSQFVDDSFSGDYYVPLKFPETETETVTLVSVNPSFKNMVHKRARSKRSRTGGSVLSLPLADSSTSSSSTSSCTSKPLLATEQSLGKRKRSPAMNSGRRCSHCLVQKTPQWRAGPLGAKTLCNACGVRFKSGRLLPEYRPACSPTFSSKVHSNNHRKVLEMRRKKAENMYEKV